MKKILALFLTILLVATCFVSCEKEPEMETTQLTKENIKDYVSIDLTFGELSITDLSHGSTERKVLSCLCTITVTPNADYNFENACIRYQVKDNGEWEVVMTNTDDDAVSNPMLYADGAGVKLYLDKEGYGSDTFYLWQTISPSLTAVNINKHHPSQLRWGYDIKAVEGSVLKNTKQ